MKLKRDDRLLFFDVLRKIGILMEVIQHISLVHIFPFNINFIISYFGYHKVTLQNILG